MSAVTRWIAVVILALLGLAGIGARLYVDVLASLGKATAIADPRVLYVSVGALVVSIALAGWWDDIAANAKSLVDLIRPFLPSWGKKDPP